MSFWQNNEWLFYTKVLNSAFHEYLLQMADKSLEPFPFDIITGIDSATIYYVKDADKKDFPENGKISKIEVTDKAILESIQKAWLGSAVPTITYPSREDSDIVFHTRNGDYYGKIKFSITEDEIETTIIMQGFFGISVMGSTGY